MTKVAVPKERGQFRALLLANPNHFGNLASALKPVVSIQSDTTYEVIACVGYQPQAAGWLEAVVYVNQSSGYDGGLCSNGSQEYVRFYLSNDGGATWLDQGLTSSRYMTSLTPGRWSTM